jgi:hypothetical protein
MGIFANSILLGSRLYLLFLFDLSNIDFYWSELALNCSL